jgi:DNA-binding XRE family transcriptional regulator
MQRGVAVGPVSTIRDIIHRHRKESYLTQGDLAHHLGVTKASAFKWETGKRIVESLREVA